MLQRTLTILKPDTVSARRCGAVIDRLEREGFAILGVRTLHLTQTQAEAFYAVHRQRPFFASLVKFMTEGPIWVLALERENAVVHLRTVMGATNPANAEEGTIRKEFALSMGENSVHGSDSLENAGIEIAQFFTDADIVG